MRPRPSKPDRSSFSGSSGGPQAPVTQGIEFGPSKSAIPVRIRAGALLPLPPTEPSIVSRFESLIDRSAGPDVCHPWTGKIGDGGYGVFYPGDGRKAVRSHRFACFLAHGAAPDGKPLACHSLKCVTTACCNGDHLRWDDTKGNSSDVDTLGRRPRGETALRSKLTEAQIAEIIAAAPTIGWGKRRILAARYGVTGQQIGRILAGKTWKHVTTVPPAPAPQTLAVQP